MFRRHACIIVFGSLFLGGIAPATPCWGASATVTANVSDDGGVEVRVVGTFDSCTKCDTSGLNCKTENLGSVSLSWVEKSCREPASGTATCSIKLDRADLDGTHTFTGYASNISCGGSVSGSYTLTLDNTPTVSISAPTGTLSAPFDIVGAATFKPTLKPIKGTIRLSVSGTNTSVIKECTTENCSFSYQELKNTLYDLDHSLAPFERTATLTARATGGSAGVAEASASSTFYVDKTPTISISAPTGTLSAPFDIIGAATFKPTLNPVKGWITLYVSSQNIFYPSGQNTTVFKECTTENCSFSYQELTNTLYDLNHYSFDYTATLTAKALEYASSDGIRVSATSTFKVDKTPTISISAPVGTLSAPFDIIGAATFKPTLLPIKGTIKLSINGRSTPASKDCTTENCSFSYQELMHTLYDLDHALEPYKYTAELTATAPGGSYGVGQASADSTFYVDKTPTVSINAPRGTLAAPSDIVGAATFKPALDPSRRTIKFSINGGSTLASKECITDNCSFNYQELKNVLMDQSGPYIAKMTASAPAYPSSVVTAIATSTFNVDKIIQSDYPRICPK